MNVKIGIPQWCFPGGGIYCMDMAAKLGMTVIHIDLGSFENSYPLSQELIQERFMEDARKNNITIMAMALNDLCTHGFAKSGKHAEIAYLTIRKGVEQADKMGIPAITIPSFFDNAIETQESFQRTAEALRYCCDLAGQRNINIYTENVLLPEKLYELISLVNVKNLKVLYDCQNYHIIKGYNSAEILKEICDKVDLGDFLHLKDGIETMGNRYLGEGDCGVQDSINILKEKQYTGSIFIENNYSLLPVDYEQEDRRLTAIQKDIDILRDMMVF